MLLKGDLEGALNSARFIFPTFDKLSDVRQEVLVNMTFNMGRNRMVGFRKMRLALIEGDHAEASVQMLDSKWASQVGARARELALRMKTGEVSE